MGYVNELTKELADALIDLLPGSEFAKKMLSFHFGYFSDSISAGKRRDALGRLVNDIVKLARAHSDSTNPGQHERAEKPPAVNYSKLSLASKRPRSLNPSFLQ